MLSKKTMPERIFDASLYVFLAGIFLVTFYPFWNILVISLNDATDTMRGNLYFWPRVPTIESYVTIFRNPEIWNAIQVTVLRTVVGTAASIFFITLLAYPLSKRSLLGWKYFSFFFVFTMYFGGGLIPTYMIIKSLGLIDSFWVYIFPGLIGVFLMILVRTFMEQIPGEIEESSKIDGANDLQTFFRIIMPLCVPVLATIGLFLAIGHWNSWYDSYVYTYKPELKTLQAVLVKILNQFQTAGMISDAQQLAQGSKRIPVSSESIRMAVTMVATLPIIMVYPFVQRYFVKGIMMGAIKS
ncbi:binding-protein-dependent transport systems inner membrane component [Paenibacillus vortex V453]|jgi:putative aldouronate transport system permease protein|uniref:Binding-protein-dependent transport systems inner membrane component n=1 Tax=Paenibacillus vortex V453 TaxID=715225 RepID=A0A2R9SQM3_9BACL|nr:MULTISPECIES: carbohydrate ABC transporter permease [Paenibacillus]ANA78550.1 sugar ABC transporter permease [Paenibacillus glucanolyticus]AVV57533.1 carbohydrate ABC transporter permease [Paenibacillus glucanolyticus]EFU39642.1 binding-protein-dependent transport systems inner membrane component [Paenibacillus vortex V453]ETT34971.1 binding-protein-dependent transport systems inner membrane component [Paenibacillus sp. FSL R5-808]